MGKTGADYFKKNRGNGYYSDGFAIATYIFLGINTCLLFFHVYHMYRFYLYRDSIAIARRHPALVLLFDVVLLLFSHLYSPYQVFLVNIQSFTAPFWTSWFFFGATCYGVTWIFLMRAWLLYYAHGYHTAIANGGDPQNWFISVSQTWGDAGYVFWRILAGWIFWTAALTFSAIWVETVFPRYMTVVFAIILLGAGGAFMGVIYLYYLLHYSQDVKDVFHIQDELFAGAIVTFACCLFYAIDHLLWLFSYRGWVNRDKNIFRDRMDSFIYYILCLLWSNVIMYFSNARVLFKNDKFLAMKLPSETVMTRRSALQAQKKKHMDWSFVSETMTGLSETSEDTSRAAIETPRPMKLDIVDEKAGMDGHLPQVSFDETSTDPVEVYRVLVYDSCFRLFSDHLRREFSGEILYGFVELTQYVIHCMEQGFWDKVERELAEEDANAQANAPKADSSADDSGNSNERGQESARKSRKKRRRRRKLTKPQFLPNFADCAPKSLIIEAHPAGGAEDENDSFMSYKQIAYAILEKYMLAGSPLELNIPASVRMKLVRTMKDKETWLSKSVDESEMLFLFEKVRMEMKKMLHFSLNLMKSTVAWVEMKQALASMSDSSKPLSSSISPTDYDDTHNSGGGSSPRSTDGAGAAASLAPPTE